MTSGKFQTLPIDQIVIVRADRQRREVKENDINDLAESLHRIGLINPIVITEDGVLVAGETRLLAARSLGWTSIPVQFVDDLSPLEIKTIELEENIKRKALTWQDECLAVAELHELRKTTDPEWTQAKTADAIGLSPAHVSRQLDVAKEINAGNERVATADKFSIAHNVVQRTSERAKASSVANVAASVTAMIAPDAPAVEAAPPPIILADFHLWQESYDGSKFNLIHCDFPYGINVADSPRQNAAIKDYYRDSPDIYWALLERLGLAMGNVVADSAHLIFWFSMDYYSQTVSALSEMGWKVNPFPLVWHKSDNAGIAPDPQRLPRRTYETALFASRGDRKLTQVGAKSNSFAFPGKRGEDDHISEKPLPMLKHFMSMVCDEYSILLDPTCGSGNAVKVAQALQGQALGLEINEEFYARTIANWNADETPEAP